MVSDNWSLGARVGFAFEHTTPEATVRLGYAEIAVAKVPGGAASILEYSLYGQAMMQKALAAQQIGIGRAEQVDWLVTTSLDNLQCRDAHTQQARVTALITAMRIHHMRLSAGENEVFDRKATVRWTDEAECIMRNFPKEAGGWEQAAASIGLHRAINALYSGNRTATLATAARGIIRARRAADTNNQNNERNTYVQDMTHAQISIMHATFQKPAERDNTVQRLLNDPALYGYLDVVLQAGCQRPKPPAAA